MHAGNWANNADWCYWDYPLIELKGKAMGIIGFGRIGQAEARIAKALGMNVLAYDLYPNDPGRAIVEYVTLDELYTRADVITLHYNLTMENTGMINKDSIAKMKDGVILINNNSLTSRTLPTRSIAERWLWRDWTWSTPSRSARIIRC